jgi:hypothetical protein
MTQAPTNAVAVLALALVLPAFGCGDRTGQPPTQRSGPEQHTKLTPPKAAWGLRSDKIYQVRDKPPLRGGRARARAGDWVVRNERLLAVFRARDGRLVDLGFVADRKDILHRFDTTLTETRGRSRVYYSRLRPVVLADGKTHALELWGRFREAGLDVEVRTRVWAPRGAWYLKLHTTVTNRAGRRSLALEPGDSVYFGNTRHFAPGHGLVRKSLRHHAYWVTRQLNHRVVGLVTAEKRPMRLRWSISEEPFNPTTHAIYGRRHLGPSASFGVSRYLFMHHGTNADASALIQRLLGGPVGRIRVTLAGLTARDVGRLRPEVVVTRNSVEVLRSLLTRPRATMTLPAGHRYQVRVDLPGAGLSKPTAADLTMRKDADSPTVSPTVSLTLEPPPHGTLAYQVTGADAKPLPSRLFIHGVAPTPTPNFGDDGTVDGTLNVIYARTGAGARTLAPGRYRVLVTRGLEYGLHEAQVTIARGKATALKIALGRHVDTTGAISADLHLHAAPSMDSDLSLTGRLIQLAAVGVEYAVATDHNAITDYRPAARKARLGRWLATVVGCEITTRRAEWGHFNIFPVDPNGPVPPYTNQTPHEMFSHWHSLPTHPVIQVNHPRMGGIGYYNQVDLDRRHGKAFSGDFATSYDAVEVFNGDWMYKPHHVERNLRDWYMLLNTGHRFTATGNSDAHRLGYQEAGYPRNFVLVGGAADDPTRLPKNAVENAIRKHRVVVSSGPYITLTRPVVPATPQSRPPSVVGAQLKAATGQTTVLELTVQAACWVPVDSVEVVANGKTLVKIQLPRKVRRAVPTGPGKPARCDAIRLRRTLKLTPKRDTWYVVVARSRTPLRVLRRKATAVFAFTNPVWIDADGDGRFTPPGIPPKPPLR